MFEHECALQVTKTSSVMQSGALVARTENQIIVRKTKHNKNSVTNFKHEYSGRRAQSYLMEHSFTQFASAIK